MTLEAKRVGGRKKKCRKCGSTKTKKTKLIGIYKNKAIWVCQDCKLLFQGRNR